MSRNYDNWERLVAAVVKRDQIWQLCHQDSISTVSSDYSSDLESSLPISLGSFGLTDTFEFVQRLGQSNFTTTDLVRLVQDHVTKVIKSLDGTENVTEDEFVQHMLVLGNCRHENVAIPWAYYFSETTKIIVYDYYSQGSVFDMLRGNKSTLDWESRVRIAIGAARGMAHIHAQCEGKLAHGNIKSSNIFVNPQGYGCVSDFSMWGAGFKTPSQDGDVYSFGELLLELIARDSMGASFIARHIHSNRYEYDCDWAFAPIFVDEVDRLFSESLYSEVMDSAVQQEVRRTLQVARRCLSLIPEERPRMCQVALELDQIAQPRAQTYRNHRGDKKKKEALWHDFLHFRR